MEEEEVEALISQDPPRYRKPQIGRGCAGILEEEDFGFAGIESVPRDWGEKFVL